MMYKKNMLLSAMAEKGMTAAELSSVLGVNPATLSRKINGKSEFTRAELQQIRTALNLTIADAEAIFFAV